MGPEYPIGEMLMARLSTTLTAAFAVLALAPAQARAQSVPPTAPTAAPANQDSDLAEAGAMIAAKVAVLAETLGIATPPVPREALEVALREALPQKPESDTRTWGASFGFDIRTDVVEGQPLAADPEGYVVLRDARGCVPSTMTGPTEIVAFERFSRSGVDGHHCVVTGMSDDVWIVHAATYAQGDDRRVLTTYIVAAAIDGDPVASKVEGDAHLAANISLSRAMGDYGVSMLLLAKPGQTVDLPAAAERMGELVKAIANEAGTD